MTAIIVLLFFVTVRGYELFCLKRFQYKTVFLFLYFYLNKIKCTRMYILKTLTRKFKKIIAVK